METARVRFRDKLTEEQVLDIRSRPVYWGSQTILAKEFNVSSFEISNIINNKGWRHI